MSDTIFEWWGDPYWLRDVSQAIAPEVGVPAIAARERAMLKIMNMITEKHNWNIKIFDSHYAAKWREEAHELVSDKAWAWCLAELQDKALDYERYGFVKVLDGPGICKARLSVGLDADFVKDDELERAIDSLSEVIVHDGYHRLPCEVCIDDGVRITSAVAGAPSKQYPAFETIIAAALPMWRSGRAALRVDGSIFPVQDETKLKAYKWALEMVKTQPHRRLKVRGESLTAAKIAREWRPVEQTWSHPEPGIYKKSTVGADLSGNIQVIVQVSGVTERWTSEWHREELNENIVATLMYAYDVVGMTVRMEFREQVDVPRDVPREVYSIQQRHKQSEHFGYLGVIRASRGRLLTWSNTTEHRLSTSETGHFRYVLMRLVDPCRPILSMSWYGEVPLLLRQRGLAQELVDKIMESGSDPRARKIVMREVRSRRLSRFGQRWELEGM